MGKLKKVGIGFGITVLVFFVFVIIVGTTYDGTDNAKPQKNPTQPEKTISEKESETYAPATIGGMPMEPGVSYKVSESGTTKVEDDSQLDAEDLQKIIVGFETYNKSVKILLDACGNVESEADFRLLGELIAEYGDEFIDNTTSFGAVRDKLVAEGYGEHPVLGPLMNETVMLVDLMSACMEVLAWEFSG